MCPQAGVQFVSGPFSDPGELSFPLRASLLLVARRPVGVSHLPMLPFFLLLLDALFHAFPHI